MNTLGKIRNTAILTRPHNSLIALASVIAGAFLASGRIAPGALLTSVMAFFVCAGGYVLNDMYDIGSDAVNRPARPLVVGSVTRSGAGGLVIALWAVGLGFAMLGGRVAVIFCLGWMVALWLYSHKLKTLGIFGHVAVSAGASSSFILGALSGGDARAGLMPFAIASLFHLAREIAKGVGDARGDSAAGVSTLAVRLGARRSLRAVLWCIGGVMVFSLVPVIFGFYAYLYLLPVVFVIYPLLLVSMVKITRAGNDAAGLERAARTVSLLLKAGMPAGLAAFFLAGI